MKQALLTASLLLLIGCQASTGVMVRGENTYAISRRDTGPFSSLNSSKDKTYKEATEFCAKNRKVVKILSEDYVGRTLGQFPESEVLFACIDP